MATNPKIRYGNVEVTEEDIAPEATRVRISIMVPGDVLKRIREMAAEQHKPYQTLMNEMLRSAAMQPSRSVEERLSWLEAIVQSVLADPPSTGRQALDRLPAPPPPPIRETNRTESRRKP